MYEYRDIDKAKLGDVVECVDVGIGNSLTIGKLYLVVDNDGSLGYMGDGRESTSFMNKNSSRWKLVKTKPGSEAKVGDNIIMTEYHGGPLAKGSIHTISGYANGMYEFEGFITVCSDDTIFKVLCREVEQFNPRILQEYIPVHCATEEQAITLLEWAHKCGKKWSGRNSFIEDNNWANYEEDTCYVIYEGTYGNTTYHNRYDHNIWTYEDALLGEQL